MKNASRPNQNESVRFPVSTAATIASTNVVGRSTAANVHRMRQLYAEMDEAGTTRLETFSDGVFAIAATLLVLEIAVDTRNGGALRRELPKNLPPFPPHAVSFLRNGGTLGSELLKIWPSYLAYVMSFLTIGVIWINHHHCVTLIARVDRPFLFINTLLLLVVSFIPFPTKLVAQYLQKPGEESAVLA